MIKYAGDTCDKDLMQLACENADALIRSRLSQYNIPVPEDDVPDELELAGRYYAVSDILQSLYAGEERSGNEKAYFDKAESLLTNYVESKLESMANDELKYKSPIGVSQSPDPYQAGILRR